MTRSKDYKEGAHDARKAFRRMISETGKAGFATGAEALADLSRRLTKSVRIAAKRAGGTGKR
jgi:hypothetical protein